MNVSMRRSLLSAVVSLCCAASPALAQQAQSPSPGSPVSNALRMELQRAQRNLVAAAEQMPAEKYAFKPTQAQMSFGQLVLHVAGSNDFMCGTISGTKAPDRTKLQATDNKDVLVTRIKDSFAFCTTALAQLDDSKMGDMVPFFGGRQVSRAAAALGLTGDWYDHYGAAAIYMRLNGQLPPTAKRAVSAAM